MDADAHKKYIGVDNDLILENLKRLSADGARIFIRLPLIDGVNATTQMIEQVIVFLTENHIRVDQVNLLPYHNTGQHKYNKLDRPYNEDGLMKKPVDELMNQFMEFFIAVSYTHLEIHQRCIIGLAALRQWELQQCDHHDKPGKGIPGLSLVEFHQGVHIVLALRRLAAGKYAVYQIFQHVTEPFPVLLRNLVIRHKDALQDVYKRQAP